LVKAATKSILIVDDQDDEREIQRALLEHLGYRVLEAADGESALEVARRVGPDLILLDVAMPRMDGYAVCERIRADADLARIVVLFYTATPDPDVEERVRTVGASGVLIKPVDPHEVAEAVLRLIGPPAAG
jgi:CheY-like chemotaxis protein